MRVPSARRGKCGHLQANCRSCGAGWHGRGRFRGHLFPRSSPFPGEWPAHRPNPITGGPCLCCICAVQAWPMVMFWQLAHVSKTMREQHEQRSSLCTAPRRTGGGHDARRYDSQEAYNFVQRHGVGGGVSVRCCKLQSSPNGIKDDPPSPSRHSWC